jgi:hypothetical protein
MEGLFFTHAIVEYKSPSLLAVVGEISPLDVPVAPVVGCATDSIHGVINIVICGVDEFNAGIGFSIFVGDQCPSPCSIPLFYVPCRFDCP